MVDAGDGTWVDIYNVSVDEAIVFASGNGSQLLTGSCKSAYNAVPLTGTEGLTGYNFNKLAGRSGKRLMTLSEWYNIAEGSPQGNNGDNVNAWSATANTARQNTGYVPYAISEMNTVDCVGNVYEWLSDITSNPTGTSPAWYDVMSGMSVGQLYMHNTAGVFQVLAGGSWYIGIIAGPRCANFSNYPWLVDTSAGCRFACSV
jgi:formylglycine-generating enzyme required for sulfatase activity